MSCERQYFMKLRATYCEPNLLNKYHDGRPVCKSKKGINKQTDRREGKRDRQRRRTDRNSKMVYRKKQKNEINEV